MEFAQELAGLLLADLPNRETVVAKAARHLELIVEANQHFNLTRIVSPREAAIKHVVDSVLPWALFANAKHVLDVGSGAGFPGIPLSLVLPGVRFTLAESIGKKARFLQAAVSDLQLPNVTVAPARAEDILRTTRPDILTARAVAPLQRALELVAGAIKSGATALLYKGPDTQTEIAEAAAELKKHRLHARVVLSYLLPDDAGTRTIIAVTR